VYLWNAHACGTLYPLIGAVEISLRNAIDQALTADLGRFWWTSAKLRYRSFAPGVDAPRPVQAMREKFAKATREYVAEQRRRHAVRGKVTPHHQGVMAKTSFSTWELLLDDEFLGRGLIWPKHLSAVFRGRWPTHQTGLMLAHARKTVATTHKHRLHNAIISHPERLGDDHFQAALLLDERSELMNDHQTGQHIQGMILIEAARQMFLAVTEEYFIGEQASEPYYFVINQMSVNFTGFVFPVEAILDYQINSKDVSNPSRLRFDVTTSIVQGGISATEISFQFTAYYAANIKKKENQQAEKLLQTLCIAASRVNENADTAHP